MSAAGAPPRVSIVMPVFNAADWLEASIGSALAQDFSDFELICVDDGSTDASAALIAARAPREARLRLLRLDANEGPSAARNAGIDTARGEFLFMLDADDTLPPDALSSLVAAADSSGCDLVAGQLDWRRTPDDTGPAETPSGSLRVEAVSESRFLQSVPGSHCCNLYRLGALREAGIRYPLDLRLGEDQLFQVEALLAAGRVAILERIVYVYHHYRGQSLTRQPPEEAMMLDEIEFQRRIARAFAAHGLPEVARWRLRNWSWSIREYWLRMPAALAADACGRVFDAFRVAVAEFGVQPWHEATPEAHRLVLERLMAGDDADALRLLAEQAQAVTGSNA